MSSDGFARFLEAVISDERLRQLSYADLNAAVAEFELSAAQIAYLERRLNKGFCPPTSTKPSLSMHYKSTPEVIHERPFETTYLTPETDVTFDVKPNVVIPPPPTTINTISTPTPTPSPSPGPKGPRGEVSAISEEVEAIKRANGEERRMHLRQLARLLEPA